MIIQGFEDLPKTLIDKDLSKIFSKILAKIFEKDPLRTCFICGEPFQLAGLARFTTRLARLMPCFLLNFVSCDVSCLYEKVGWHAC